MERCPRCKGTRRAKNGKDKAGRYIYRCSDCGRKYTDRDWSEEFSAPYKNDVICAALAGLAKGEAITSVSTRMDISKEAIRPWIKLSATMVGLVEGGLRREGVDDEGVCFFWALVRRARGDGLPQRTIVLTIGGQTSDMSDEA